ncbi:MAG TPA: hypothetical protein VF851_01645 [Steroidobacteraceae bacterium]
MSSGISQVSVRSLAGSTGESGALQSAQAPSILETIGSCCQRGAPRPALANALVAYWLWLPRAGLGQRRELVAQVRDAVRRGTTTARAWACVALGDPDFAIVREATLGYLGTTPVSLDRREQAVADVLDWIVRELPLNRAAAFTALVDLDDPAVLERLAGCRGRLSGAEAQAVWTACASTPGSAIDEFITDWRSA